MPTPRCEPLPRSTGTIWLSSSASRGRVAWLSRTASTTPSLRCAAARACSPPPTHLSRAELTRRRAGGVPPRVPAAVPGHPAPLHLSDPVPVRAAKPHPTPTLPRGPRPPSPTAFRLFGSPDAVGSYQDLWYISGPSEEEANKLRQPVAAILIVADPIPCTLAPQNRCRLPSQPTGICSRRGTRPADLHRSSPLERPPGCPRGLARGGLLHLLLRRGICLPVALSSAGQWLLHHRARGDLRAALRRASAEDAVR